MLWYLLLMFGVLNTSYTINEHHRKNSPQSNLIQSSQLLKDITHEDVDDFGSQTRDVDLGCNFSSETINGFPSFSKDNEGTLCALHLGERTTSFIYYCDGLSKPTDCPNNINHIYGEAPLITFFEQSRVTAVGPKLSHSTVWKAYVTRPLEFFEGMCICYRANGSTMTMRISAGFLTPFTWHLMAIVLITSYVFS